MARLPLFRKSDVDIEPRSEYEKARLRRLHGWALGFAVTVSFAAMPPMVFGFGWPAFVFPVVHFMGLFPLLLSVNQHTVTRMHDDPPPPVVPRYRVAISFVLGMIVAGAVTLWVFQAAIDAVQSEQNPAVWDNETRQIQAGRTRDAKILNRPIPVVEREAAQLQDQLDTAKTRLSEATNDVICEEDGTCGTGSPGRGDAYHTKLAYQNDLAAQVADLQLQLDQAKQRIAQDAMRLSDERDDAMARQRDRDRRRDELGPRPAGATRLDAVLVVADLHKVPVSVVCFGSFVGFLALDLLWLYTIARRICRPADGNGRSIEHLVNDREDRDASNIKVFNELPPQMREKYRTAGGDD